MKPRLSDYLKAAALMCCYIAAIIGADLLNTI